MYITGYHGTSVSHAKSIMKEGFWLSASNKEWLGEGIYFYFDLKNALKWKKASAVIFSVVKVPESAYIDIDSEEGQKLVSKILKRIDKGSLPFKASDDAEENQCSVMKLIWRTCPSVQVLSASFTPQKSTVNMLLDPSKKRKEFCVRNNTAIVYKHCIKRSELK